jgi:hypothetical protein
MCPPRDSAPAQMHAPFDPKGTGYDYSSATGAGFAPGDDGHWPSRAPMPADHAELLGLPSDSGLLLKGEMHPTFQKGVYADRQLGYVLVPRGNRNYSVKY